MNFCAIAVAAPRPIEGCIFGRGGISTIIDAVSNIEVRQRDETDLSHPRVVAVTAVNAIVQDVSCRADCLVGLFRIVRGAQ